MDRDVYDRDWFDYSVIWKDHVDTSLNSSMSQQFIQVKVIEISDKGVLQEHLSFIHPKKRTQELHLYFNSTYNKMIELVISKEKRQTKTTYNLYARSANSWVFEQTLDDSIAWHKKSLYPYNLDMETFSTALKHESIQYDTYKIMRNG
jgi:hypothetical protein